MKDSLGDNPIIKVNGTSLERLRYGKDLTAFQEENPDWIEYNPRRRAYINTRHGS